MYIYVDIFIRYGGGICQLGILCKKWLMLFWPRDADKSPETGSLAGHVGTPTAAAIFFYLGKQSFWKYIIL